MANRKWQNAKNMKKEATNNNVFACELGTRPHSFIAQKMRQLWRQKKANRASWATCCSTDRPPLSSHSVAVVVVAIVIGIVVVLKQQQQQQQWLRLPQKPQTNSLLACGMVNAGGKDSQGGAVRNDCWAWHAIVHLVYEFCSDCKRSAGKCPSHSTAV